MDNKELMQEVGKRWKAMSEAERKVSPPSFGAQFVARIWRVLCFDFVCFLVILQPYTEAYRQELEEYKKIKAAYDAEHPHPVYIFVFVFVLCTFFLSFFFFFCIYTKLFDYCIDF
jgi:hypothetical protein